MLKLNHIFFFLLLTVIGAARSTVEVTHYSVADGLSENHILCILQDQKGLLWFGTFNGLNKFDGYSFTCYKGKDDQPDKLANFRIDRIVEDHQGYLWVQTDDGRIYRFHPGDETFLPVPQCLPEYKDFDSPINRIDLLSDGTLWLSDRSDGNRGCLQVKNIQGSKMVSVRNFHPGTHAPGFKINKIVQDQQGNTWFLTSSGLSLLRKNETGIQALESVYSGQMLSVYENSSTLYFGCENGKILLYDKLKKSFDLLRLPGQEHVYDLFPLSKDELYISTNSPAIYLYSIPGNSFQAMELQGFTKDKVFDSYQDQEKNIWIDTDKPGAVLFNATSRKLEYLTVDVAGKHFNTNARMQLIEDEFRNRWIITRKSGTFRFNQENHRLEAIVDPSQDKTGINALSRGGICDRQGNLWLYTYMQGVDKIVFREQPFSFTKLHPATVYHPDNEVRSVFEDSRQQLWVGTRNGKVLLYDKNRKLLGQLGLNGRLNGTGNIPAPIYDIFEDRKGRIWLASRGNGLYRLTARKENEFELQNFIYDPDDIYSLSNDNVYSLIEDRYHQIWIATLGGGVNLLKEKDGKTTFINIRNQLSAFPAKNFSKVRYLSESKDGNLYACTTGGLLVFNPRVDSPEKIRFQAFVHEPENSRSLLGGDVYNVLTTHTGDLYITSIGGGINRVRGGIKPGQQPEFEKIENVEGRKISSVYTLREDSMGNIWMSAQSQIYKYLPDQNKTEIFRPGSYNNYFFSEAAVCQTRAGKLVYGTSNGFFEFNPFLIQKSKYVPRLLITQLNISGKRIMLRENGEILLESNQNNFSVEFAAIDYNDPSAIQYAYQMEGLEKDWNYAGTQRVATYNNLPKGSYVFRVKSTNSEGRWCENELSFRLIKKPAFWESRTGILLLVMFFVLLSLSIVYVLFTIFRLRNEVDVERRISNFKLRFFTDISHELRTPLTLIATPVENLLKRENLPEKVEGQLVIVKKNTDRMLRLINQILDFRKIQNNKMSLVIEEVDISELVREICTNFSKYAEEQHLQLNLIDQSNQSRLWIDRDKFEKILFNLLSNALKFSADGKTIDVIVFEEIDYVGITVRDQGVGISKDRLRLLFERFESFASRNISSSSGTGIGLSLTKELMDLHRGKISVDSVTGKGTSVTVTFLKGTEHYQGLSELNIPEANMLESDQEEDQAPATHEERNTLLIAEDNEELRQFLKSALSEKYKILEAKDGKEALDKAFLYTPDLIVSDLMMPEMDGIELAGIIRKDINTSHIPFIVLTAKTELDSKLEAMKLCVDDYITKPFSLAYVEARIENLLNIRKQLQSHFQRSMTSGVITLSKPEVTSIEEVFMGKTLKYLEENHDNPAMNIDDIASEAGVSRSSFFNKIKSLTGLAPVDFVREYRLQKALQLIEGGETRISQIAYTVGITDPKYFSRCFKQRFGVNPSEYKLKSR